MSGLSLIAAMRQFTITNLTMAGNYGHAYTVFKRINHLKSLRSIASLVFQGNLTPILVYSSREI